MHEVHVFISHSWAYTDHFNKLCEWIFGQSWNVDGVPIRFVDHSVPKDSPIHNAPTVALLQQRINERIAVSNVVVIPTGMYATRSKWIQREIDGAALLAKPILAVDPWGQQRASSVVVEASAKAVGWNKDSVVSGIWELHRG